MDQSQLVATRELEARSREQGEKRASFEHARGGPHERSAAPWRKDVGVHGTREPGSSRARRSAWIVAGCTLSCLALVLHNTSAAESSLALAHEQSSTVNRAEPQREFVLSPEKGAYEPRFGATLAASARWLAVGAPMDHDDGNTPGSVHLYAVNRTPQLRVDAHEVARADSPIAGDRFGIAVAIRFGETPEPEILVGCDESDEILPDAGCVRVLHLDEGRLESGAILFSPRPEPGEAFGHAIAVSAGCIVIGAPRGDSVEVHSDPNGSIRSTPIYDAGHAYIFSRNSQSGAWHATATLDRETPESSAWFGRALAASGDWIAVGAPGVDALEDGASSQTAMSVGEVSVFHRDASGDWNAHATLRPPRVAAFAAFGSSIALEGDTLIVGAPGYTTPAVDGESNHTTGAVFVFTLTDASLQSPAVLTAPDGAASASFGVSVALARGQLLIGAPGANDAGQSSGAAWRFGRDDSESPFFPTARLRAASAGEMFLFGSATALLDRCAVVGRFHDEESGHPQGSTHLFPSDAPLIAHRSEPDASTSGWKAASDAAP